MNILNRFKFAGLAAALSLAVGACATSTPKPLEEARATYAQAEQSHASRYAPTELQQARQTLIRAEQAYEQSADSQTAHTLAYLALRRAQQAMASAELNYLATTRKAKENQLFAQTDAARRDYRQQLNEQRQKAAQASQLSEQQLRQQRAQLQDALSQLDSQQSNSADITRLRAQYQSAMDQLDAEIQRRQQAEARLNEVTDRLAEVADVEQKGSQTIISINSATLFEVGKSELLPMARQNLQQVAEALKLQPDVNLTVAGFTSSTGSDSFNQQLSEDRANSVKDYLASQGIAANRIDTVGYGEDRPIATNDTEEGRAMNRRVEIVVEPSTAVGGGPADSGDQNQPDQFDDSPQPGDQDYLDDAPHIQDESDPTGGGPVEPGEQDNFDNFEQPLDQSDPGIQDSPLPPVDQVLPEDNSGQIQQNTPRNDDQMLPDEQMAPDYDLEPGQNIESPEDDSDGLEENEPLDQPEGFENDNQIEGSDDWPGIIEEDTDPNQP